MNPYAIADLASGSAATASLRARLEAWHDAMVTHERRLRADPAADPCDDDCPHGEAPRLWREAAALLGPLATQLTFLRSRALGAGTSPTRERWT